MAPITIFRRKLVIASDDLTLPSLIGSLLRLAWLVVNAYLLHDIYNTFSEENDNASCQDLTSYNLVLGYFGAGMLMAFFSFVVYTRMYLVSLHGSIIAGSSIRSYKMKHLIKYLLACYMFELGINVTGTVLLVNYKISHGESCEEEESFMFARLLSAYIIVWIDLLVFLITSYLLVNQGATHSQNNMGVESDYRQLLHASWERRLRIWCTAASMITCNLFGTIRGETTEKAYEQVASVFSEWFEDVNFTLTDLVAGLVLLKAQQREKEKGMIEIITAEYKESIDLNMPQTNRKLSKHSEKAIENYLALQEADKPPRSFSFTSFEPKTPVQRLKCQSFDSAIEMPETALDELLEFQANVPHMLGIYGFKLFAFMHLKRPFQGVKGLFKQSYNTYIKQFINNADNYKDRSCCNLHTSTIHFHNNTIASSKSKSSECVLVYASFQNYLGTQVPHCVIVDHSQKAVVVSCRGTMSLNDLLTDAQITPFELSEAGKKHGFSGAGHYGHHGMYQIADCIKTDMVERYNVLGKLLGQAKSSKKTTHNERMKKGENVLMLDDDELPDCTGYSLRIVGHSLGGGIGAYLGLMLRPVYPELKCLAFSSPGCMFSKELADEVSSFVTTLWVGKDIVPRLNWQNFVKIRLQIYDLLARCKVSKTRVLRLLVTKEPLDNLLYPDMESVPKGDVDVDSTIHHIQRIQEKEAGKTDLLSSIPMYLPGRLIHLDKIESVHTAGCFCTRKERVFKPMLVTDRTAVNEYAISPYLFLHHFPHLVGDVLSKIIADATDPADSIDIDNLL